MPNNFSRIIVYPFVKSPGHRSGREVRQARGSGDLGFDGAEAREQRRPQRFVGFELRARSGAHFTVQRTDRLGAQDAALHHAGDLAHQALERQVNEGRFRSDLYFRLRIVPRVFEMCVNAKSFTWGVSSWSSAARSSPPSPSAPSSGTYFSVAPEAFRQDGYGQAWVSFGQRKVAPVTVPPPTMGIPQVGGTRFLRPDGFQATRWGTRITPEARVLYPLGFREVWGWPEVRNRVRFLEPDSIRTPRPSQ